MSEMQLELESGEPLSVRRFVVEESASALFSVTIWARSENHAIDLDALVGRAASFRVVHGGRMLIGGGTRTWTGVCSHAEQVQAEPTGLSTYCLRIVPRLYLLTQRTNYRVFQHLSIPDIVEALLTEGRVPHEWRITKSKYPKLEIKIQYGESDYTFLSRLLEEAGIAFVFRDREPIEEVARRALAQGSLAGGTELTLDDALPSREERMLLPYVDNPNQAAEREFVTRLRLTHEVRPGAFTLRDFDFRNPGFPLFAEAPKARGLEEAYEQYQYRPGSFLIERESGGGDTPTADDQGIARYVESYGTEQATRGLVASRVGRRSVAFDSNAFDLCPGSIFRVGLHPHQELSEDARLLVVESRMEGTHDGEWLTSARAIFAAEPYAPIAKTPKPSIVGVQSATVVGPAGEEIHTDEFGRVRVQFPWDRQGKNNERSSCWVRVSQGWAGTGFGMLVLPRIGQEVLVGFLHGDPDQPVIVGRVFNAVEDVPYKLPEHKTRSTWKSDSSMGHEGFNEIMFEDLKGKELVYVQAEKDLRKLVKHDETITVGNDRQKWVLRNEVETTGENRTEVTGVNRTEITGGNRTTIIGEDALKVVQGDEYEITEGKMMVVVGGDQDIVVKQDKRERVEGTSHLKVRGKQNQKIDGKYSLTVGTDQHVRVTKNLALDASEDVHLKAGSMLVIEATRDITLKGPGGFVRIDESGVTIRGTKVLINSGGSAASGAGSSPEEPTEAIEAEIEFPVKPIPENIQITGVPRPGG